MQTIGMWFLAKEFNHLLWQSMRPDKTNFGKAIIKYCFAYLETLWSCLNITKIDSVYENRTNIGISVIRIKILPRCRSTPHLSSNFSFYSWFFEICICPKYWGTSYSIAPFSPYMVWIPIRFITTFPSPTPEMRSTSSERPTKYISMRN